MTEQTELEYWVERFVTDELDQRRADIIYSYAGIDMDKCQEIARNIRIMETARGFVAPYNVKDMERMDRALQLIGKDATVHVHKLWLIEFLKAWLSVGHIEE